MRGKDSKKENTSIRIVGIGGGGINVVDALPGRAIHRLEPVVMDTVVAALARSQCFRKVQLGPEGLAAGARSSASIGQKAAGESREAIVDALAGAQVVFIVAGMGGGTGTGAAPILLSH